MSRILRTLVLAAAMIALGWVAGRAQTSAPAFELLVTSPIGDVTVQCVRGCALREVNVANEFTARPPGATFGFACRERCSVPIAGWTK